MWQHRTEFVPSELTPRALLKRPSLVSKSWQANKRGCFFNLQMSAGPRVLLAQTGDSRHAEAKERPALILGSWVCAAAAPHLDTFARKCSSLYSQRRRLQPGYFCSHATPAPQVNLLSDLFADLLAGGMQEWDKFGYIGFCNIVDFQMCFISLWNRWGHLFIPRSSASLTWS